MEELNIEKGKELRDKGIQQSFDFAEKKKVNWGSIAYDFLLKYVKNNSEFMAEDVRIASNGIVPEPPSKRAWGAIFVQAKRSGLIERVGYGSVKNPKAHRTPATIWKLVKSI